MPKTWLAITRNSPNTPHWDIIAIGHNKALVRQVAIESETYRWAYAHRARTKELKAVSKTAAARDYGIVYTDDMLPMSAIDLRTMPPKWMAITKIHALADWWYVVAIGYTRDGAYITARNLLKDKDYCRMMVCVVDGNAPEFSFEIRYDQPAIDLRLG